MPVMLIGLSLLYDPGISRTKPSISPKSPEWDCVKPSKVLKEKFYDKPNCSFRG